jgi:hypothetical protein
MALLITGTLFSRFVATGFYGDVPVSDIGYPHQSRRSSRVRAPRLGAALPYLPGETAAIGLTW